MRLLFPAICFLLMAFNSVNLSADPIEPSPMFKGSYEDLRDLAVLSDKMIVLVYGAAFCLPCQAMEEYTLKNPDLLEYLAPRALLYKADIQDNIDIEFIRADYPFDAIPTIYFLDANGKILNKVVSSMGVEELKNEVAKYRPSAVNEEFALVAGPSPKGGPKKEVTKPNSNVALVRSPPKYYIPEAARLANSQAVKISQPLTKTKEQGGVIVTPKPTPKPTPAIDSDIVVAPKPQAPKPTIITNPNEKKPIVVNVEAHAALDKPATSSNTQLSVLLQSDFAIQLGAFGLEQGANSVYNKASEQWPDAQIVKIRHTDATGRTLYRVLIAGFDTMASARAQLTVLDTETHLGVTCFATDTKKFR